MATPPPLIRLLHSHRVAWFGLLALLLVAGLFVALAKHKNAEMESALFESLIKRTSERIEGRFQAFFTPVLDNLEIIRRWAAEQPPSFDTPEPYNQRFIPVLQQYPQVSALILADSAGNEYFLLHNKDQWLTRLTRPAEWGKRVRWSRWRSPTELDEAWWEDDEYDPRSRPWFVGAMKSAHPGEVFWTRPYTFFTLQRPGITIAVRNGPPAPGAGKGTTGEATGTSLVIGFDVLLAEVARLTSAATIGSSGKVFALTRDDRVVGPPRDPRFAGDPAVLQQAILSPASQLAIPELTRALASWHQAGEPLGRAFKFKVDRDTWWAVFRDLAFGAHAFRIGYMAPERDYAEQLGADNGLFFWAGTGLAVIALAALAVTLVVLRRSPWDLNADASRSAPPPPSGERVRRLIAGGENERVEFKSTLRWNLNTDKPGKEVEMSWLKTVVAFLNSDGGDLLVGVEDDGQILGIAADRFPSEDKYLLHVNNLLNQHIGAERSPYIRFSLVSMADHKVLLISCTPSSAATFLTIGKQEEFYVRSGPGSRKLAPSKVVEYVNERRR